MAIRKTPSSTVPPCYPAQTPRNASSGLPASVADDVGSLRVGLYVARDAPRSRSRKDRTWSTSAFIFGFCGLSATAHRPPLFPADTESSIVAQLYTEFRLSAVLSNEERRPPVKR